MTHSQDSNFDELSIEKIFEIYVDASNYDENVFGDYEIEWININEKRS
jgi:hypothetical protein